MFYENLSICVSLTGLSTKLVIFCQHTRTTCQYTHVAICQNSSATWMNCLTWNVIQCRCIRNKAERFAISYQRTNVKCYSSKMY